MRLVALNENRGFAGGNNAGVREARGRFVVLLNNDTVPEPGWLAALLRGREAGGPNALASSRIVLHARSTRHRQRRRRAAALGRRLQAASRRERRVGHGVT